MIINRIGRKIAGGALDVQVSANADDGYWATGMFEATASEMIVGSVSTPDNAHIFARFPSIIVPAGVTIKTAYIQVYLVSVGAGTLAGNRIYLNHEQAPTAPTTESSANGKALTTAYVSFNPAAPAGWKTSDDISTPIQEVVDAHGPLSAIMILWKNSGSGDNYATFRTREYTGNAHGMKLHVEW